jgi:hypothetical protein
MKYKVKILKQPKYQDGGDMQQGDDTQNQILQIIQAFAEANGVDPKELMTKLQALGAEDQQQAIVQMYQSLQGGGQEEEQGYAQEQMQPGMQQQMGYGEEEEQDEEDDMQMAAYGGQMGYGLDLGSRRLWMNQDDDEQSMVNRSIKEVPRDEANIEAEGGETALVPNKTGSGNSHFNIQGNRHTQGGVPLNVPEGTFIYSDTKKMKLGGAVLNVFGKSDKTNKKYTPAALAKQYNLNKYTAILESPKSSQLERRTAELMIQNYNKKLAQLALVQEGKKGYPQGIPKVAEEYYAKTKAYVESQQARNKPQQEMQEQQSGRDVDQDMEQGEQMQAMYGMGFKYGGGLQKFQGDKESSQFNGVPYSYDDPVVKENNSSDALSDEYTLNDPVLNDNSSDVLPDDYVPKEDVITNYGFGIGKGGKKGMLANSKLSLPESDVPNNVYQPFNYNSAMNEFEQAKNKINNMQVGFSPITTNPDGTPSGSDAMRFNYMKNHPESFKLNYTYNNNGKEDEDEFGKYKQNIGYGLSNEDKAAIRFAQRSLPFPGVRPSKSTIKLQRPETRYADPSRALAANTEQYNAARQASAMFAGPQSRYSFNAGQYGKNAADIIGQYANQNVQAGNIAANQTADINNKQMMFDAEQTKNYNDAYREYARKLWNDKIAYDRGVTAAKIQGSQNARDRYNMNISESPYFASDDATGRMYFHSPKSRNAFYNQKTDNTNNFYASAWKMAQKEADEMDFKSDKERESYIDKAAEYYSKQFTPSKRKA